MKSRLEKNMTCVFCEIVAGRAPATFVQRWPDADALVPLGPVTPGHVLVIPHEHAADFAESPQVSAVAMTRAAEYAASIGGDCNLITSKGRAATQSVFHLHLHVVPRAVNDGLALPWYSGKRRA